MNIHDYILEQKICLYNANFDIIDDKSLIEESYNIYYEFSRDNYVEKLLLEESINNINDETDLYIVEEAVVENIKNTANKVGNKVKELWLKFKNWIKKLIDNIMISIANGEKLVTKYKTRIIERYNELKDRNVNMALYKMEPSKIDMKIFSINKDVATDDEIREMVKPGIIISDAKNRQIGDIDINNVLEILMSKKNLQNFHTQIEKEVKAEFDEIIKYSELDKEGEDKLKKAINVNKVASKLCKAYTIEFKNAYKACMSLVKHMLKSGNKNQAEGDKDRETKEDYKNIGKLGDKVISDIKNKDALICRIHMADSLIYDPTFKTVTNMLSELKKENFNIFVEHNGEKFESIDGKDEKELKDMFNTQCVRFKSGKSSKERLKYMQSLAKVLFKDKREEMLKKMKQ
jgi:hypothetical protein